MAESYDIHLTDPLSPAFKVRAFTSNGTIFPTSVSLSDTAVGADTSLLVYGKGHPEYGERTSENILHILENFSGSTEPKNPVSGQLWFERFTVIRSGGLWYEWTDGVGWAAIVPLLVPIAITDGSVNDGDYWYDGADLYLAVKEDTHPLAPTWLLRVFEDRNVGVPSITDLPRKVLKVYNGVNWEVANTVHESEVAPADPLNGDLWYDNTIPQLKIYNGSAFVSVASLYLPLTGGTLSGVLDMGSNLISNVTDPAGPQDAATRNYVDTIASGTPTNLNGLTDVTISLPVLDEYLKNNGAGQWVNVSLSLTDFGVTSSAVELNYSTGVTSAIQTQLNGKLNLSGGTMTGLITLPSNPTIPLHAATKQYVDAATGGAPTVLSDLTDVVYAGAPVTDQLLQFNGTNWFNSDFDHTHVSTEVTHIAAVSYLRDLLVGTFPTVNLSNVIESSLSDISGRLNKLDDFARREVFTAAAGSPLDTDFAFTDGTYRVGSNRLNVYLNGVKQYANERARQSLQFELFKNLSITSLLGLPANGPGSPATFNKYYLSVAVDGAPAIVIEFTLDETSTIGDLISQINAGLFAGSPLVPTATAVWSKTDTSIHIFSASTGNGSSIEITEGGNGSPAVDGLLTALTNVALGSPANPSLPVLIFTGSTIYPVFPSNVTQITADLAYEEVDDSFNPTTFGVQSSSIRFNTSVSPSAVVEMISEATSDLA